MAASGCREQTSILNEIQRRKSKSEMRFFDFLKEIIPMITEENVKSMKRFLRDIIRCKTGDTCQSPEELFDELTRYHCINGSDLDLLEDLFDVAGRTDILKYLHEFKRKRAAIMDCSSIAVIDNLTPANGRSMVSFIVWESDDEFTINKVLSFKTTICNNLKLVRTEVTFVCRIRGPDGQEIVFQLPSEVLPLLRHCTGWRKEWLFSLNVRRVHVHSEPAITVQEQKISQLRLQEDPVLVSPILRVSEAARTGDVPELKRVLDATTASKQHFLLKTRTDGATPLITACKNGNTAIVQCMLYEYDVDLEQEGTVKIDGDLIECCTPLWMASLGGHLAIVRLLLESGAEVNHTTLTNSTPLRAASFNGHTEVVRCLLSHGADVNKRNQDGNVCIMVACWNGHLGTFSLLRTAGANMDVKDNQGFSMIHCATAANNLTLLHELLPTANTAAVNAKTSEGITALMLACEKNHPDVVLLLLQKGALADEKSDKGLTAAHFCALSNDIASLHHLIDYKADLTIATDRGSTALMLACAKGYVSIVTALLRSTSKSKFKNEISSALKLRGLAGQPGCLGLLSASKGMDINIGNENSETCLMMACEKGSVEIVRILLDEGGDANAADKNGMTPLMICCRRGHDRIVPLLLRKGVLVDQQNHDQDTALHLCLRHYRESSGHRKCLELLLSTGAFTDIKNAGGETAVTVVLKNKSWCGQALELLHARGLELTTSLQDANGDTVFHKCARSGDLLSMTYLLALESKGPLQRNRDGDTPLRAAALEGSEAMTRTLINTVTGFTLQDKVEALEILGVGLLAKEISRDWDLTSVVGYWREALTLRRTHGLHLETPVPREFPLEYFLEVKLPNDLTEFESNPSAVTAQALQICDRVLGVKHSRLPSLLGMIGERFAQIGEFCRSLNIWLYVLDVQLKNLLLSSDGVEDVLNTFRCFADAFGFVLSRSENVLNFPTVHKVILYALKALKTCPVLYESRDKMMTYLLHYLSAMLEVTSGEHSRAVAMETAKAVALMGLRSSSGGSLLHLASSSRTEEISSLKEHLHFPSLQVCELLMDSGIDPIAVDSEKNTSLHVVLTKGHAESDVLWCLLKAEAHLDARNSSGKLALDLARCEKVRRVIKTADHVPSLQCLAARVIVDKNVCYKGFVPKRLESFILLH